MKVLCMTFLLVVVGFFVFALNARHVFADDTCEAEGRFCTPRTLTSSQCRNGDLVETTAERTCDERCFERAREHESNRVRNHPDCRSGGNTSGGSCNSARRPYPECRNGRVFRIHTYTNCTTLEEALNQSCGQGSGNNPPPASGGGGSSSICEEYPQCGGPDPRTGGRTNIDTTTLVTVIRYCNGDWGIRDERPGACDSGGGEIPTPPVSPGGGSGPQTGGQIEGGEHNPAQCSEAQVRICQQTGKICIYEGNIGGGNVATWRCAEPTNVSPTAGSGSQPGGQIEGSTEQCDGNDLKTCRDTGYASCVYRNDVPRRDIPICVGWAGVGNSPTPGPIGAANPTATSVPVPPTEQPVAPPSPGSFTTECTNPGSQDTCNPGYTCSQSSSTGTNRCLRLSLNSPRPTVPQSCALCRVQYGGCLASVYARHIVNRAGAPVQSPSRSGDICFPVPEGETTYYGDGKAYRRYGALLCTDRNAEILQSSLQECESQRSTCNASYGGCPGY